MSGPRSERAYAPHCDQRVLHAPQICQYCDAYPDWQAVRRLWGIAFTGEVPADGMVPCPADVARPAGSPADHRAWPGNRAASSANETIQLADAQQPPIQITEARRWWRR